MRRWLLGSGLALTLIGCASAQSTEAPEPTEATPPAPAAQTPPPPCQSERFKQFDFWIGTWDVTTTTGQFAGTNAVTREEGGCLILETWSSASGGSGQSYNFYNPATDKWRQVWVGSGSLIDYEGGLTETGSMKLEGVITYLSNAQTAPFTGEWTLNEDGTVTQHFEQYDAEKDEWAVWFTGIYTRQESEAGNEGAD